MPESMEDIVAALAPGYLDRVAAQQDHIRRQVSRLKRNDLSRLNELFELTRRMSIDASAFGFPHIGAAAEDLHELLGDCAARPSVRELAHLDDLLEELDAAVSSALRTNSSLRESRPVEQRVA